MGVAVAVPLGVISATMQGTVVDQLARFIGVLGLSVPSYVNEPPDVFLRD